MFVFLFSLTSKDHVPNNIVTSASVTKTNTVSKHVGLSFCLKWDIYHHVANPCSSLISHCRRYLNHLLKFRENELMFFFLFSLASKGKCDGPCCSLSQNQWASGRCLALSSGLNEIYIAALLAAASLVDIATILFKRQILGVMFFCFFVQIEKDRIACSKSKLKSAMMLSASVSKMDLQIQDVCPFSSLIWDIYCRAACRRFPCQYFNCVLQILATENHVLFSSFDFKFRSYRPHVQK